MNLGAKERAEAAVSTLRERGESAKQPSLLTALGHDVLLALTIIERLEEQLETAQRQLAADVALLTRLWAWVNDSPEPSAAVLDEIDGRLGFARVALAASSPASTSDDSNGATDA